MKTLSLVAFLLVVAPAASEIHVPTAAALAAAETKPQPEYAGLARQMRVTGDVVVEVEILETGEVGEVKVISGNALLTSSVVKTIKTWRFKPFEAEGKPSAARTVLRFTFK